MPKLKRTLTQVDLQLIEDLIWKVTKQVVKYELNESLEPMKERISHLPTKDEFYTKMDQVMGELQTTRQEQSILTQHDVDQNDRLDRLESIHPNYQHS